MIQTDPIRFKVEFVRLGGGPVLYIVYNIDQQDYSYRFFSKDLKLVYSTFEDRASTKPLYKRE